MKRKSKREYQLPEKITKILTPNQKKVLGLWLGNFTQRDISKLCQNTQSAISKSLFGNQIYSGGGAYKKKYGGIYKKLFKHSQKNLVLSNKLLKILNSRDQMWSKVETFKIPKPIVWKRLKKQNTTTK